MEQRLARALKMAGGYYELEDILSAIREDEMQSFTDGMTWVITRVLDFPRARVLELFLVVGTLEGAHSLSDDIEAFAKKVGASRLIAQGRPGWSKKAASFGWLPETTNYYKEIV